ncbi:MAG: iron ABC transporter substrate-binding protein, partial [Oscillospiraceae bacterium]|nr:iron ABC transporter substrate-binding protein [Oscillospiraceae bacterium]
MKKMIALVLSAIVCTCLFVGCGAAGTNAQNTRTITDSAGRQVEVPEKVGSIVCVGVGALRYTCYMGAAGLVVGVEDHETKQGIDRLYNYVNHEKFKDLPITGTNGVP